MAIYPIPIANNTPPATAKIMPKNWATACEVLVTDATGIVGSEVVKQLLTQSFLSSLSSYLCKLGYKKSQIFTILILIGICSSVALVAITNYTSAYAETARPITITKIMSPRTNTPI